MQAAVVVTFMLAAFCGIVSPSHAQETASIGSYRELPDAQSVLSSLNSGAGEPAPATGTAVISGTVVDSNGNVIQDAHVALTDRGTTIERIMQSGPNGQFSFVALPAGTYKLRVTGKGMGTYVSPLITLRGDEMYLATQVVLPIAAASTDVTVYG